LLESPSRHQIIVLVRVLVIALDRVMSEHFDYDYSYDQRFTTNEPFIVGSPPYQGATLLNVKCPE